MLRAPAHVRPVRVPPTAPESMAAEAVAEVTEFHDVPPEPGVAVDARTRHEMVETAAYYIAEQRGFAPGHEVEDWRAAERSVDAALRRGERGERR